MEPLSALAVIATAILGIAVLAMLIATLFMWIGAKLAGVEKATFGRSFIAAIGSAFLTWILSLIFSLFPPVGLPVGFVIGLILVIFVIMGAYDTSFGKALLVWLFHLLAEIAAIIIGVLTFAGILIQFV
ncbi:MAG: hypothetical protein DSY91_01655 [Deltaproteobacteria bacterium]|nr:MAG: hypothetical protein DSY91_01655 [Deltaproteobacteria bacterium]